MHVPRNENRYINYRRYKHFDEKSFKHDLDVAPFYVGNIFDDVDDIFWFNNTMIQEILDGHAPIKHKKTVKYPVPFMNSKLRKACLQKAMLRNKYFKHGRSGCLWDRYRKARNHVTKLKAVSMNAYFSEKCNSDMFRKTPSNYWQTIKPFLTDRTKSTDQNISLFHDNRVINDPVKVCNIFNDYFINAASDIGKEHPIQHDENIEDILCSYKDHSIIRRIKYHVSQRSTFNFSPTTAKEVHDLLKNVDSQKATGYDNVPPKIIKMPADEFASPLTNLINLSIERSCFPSDLKKSELSPLYKCKDSLVSRNYRPLSILPSVSKNFEKIYISNYTNILSMFYRTYYLHFGRDMGVNTYWQNW